MTGISVEEKQAGEGAAAVAVADEEMDKSNKELSVPSRRGMASDMSHIFCATGAA